MTCFPQQSKRFHCPRGEAFDVPEGITSESSFAVPVQCLCLTAVQSQLSPAERLNASGLLRT